MAWVAALMVASTSCHGWWCSWARWRRWARRISGNGLTSSWAAWVRAEGPVQSRWRRQTVWCGGRRQAMGPAMREAGRAAAAGRAQQLAEAAGVAQVKAGVVPVEPRDPGQRLAGRGREALLPVPFTEAGVQDDRGGVVQGAGELQQFQVVGVSEPADVVQVVLAGDRGDGARQRPGRQCLGPVAEAGQPRGVEGHRVLRVRRWRPRRRGRRDGVQQVAGDLLAAVRMARIAAPRISWNRLPIMPPVRRCR